MLLIQVLLIQVSTIIIFDNLYVQNQSTTTAQALARTKTRMTTWLNSNFRGRWKEVSGPNVTLASNQWMIVMRIGKQGGNYDYHYWYVAPYVFRLLHMLDRPARFVVCDGDIVEPKNLDRQNFVPADLGENKARVLAERYSTVLGMETEYVPSFIEKLPDLMELIEPKEWELNPYSTKRTKEMVLLLGCVDNNKTRQLCHQAFHQSEELIYIDSGNGKYTGQVVCGVRRNGRTIRKSIGGVHPEMLKDTDLFPSEISCAEAAQEDPQSIVANVTAATAVLIMVYNILTHGENNAMQTDFSTRTIRMQTVLEKQTRRRAA